MIATCRHCHGVFWRYRKDHPPAGFCSVPHAELGPTKRPEAIPLHPSDVVLLMRQHRRLEHGSDSLLTQFDCERCEQIEELYAESLVFHVSAVTRDIAADAEKRWKEQAAV
jgi:hypothetical protein